MIKGMAGDRLVVVDPDRREKGLSSIERSAQEKEAGKQFPVGVGMRGCPREIDIIFGA